MLWTKLYPHVPYEFTYSYYAGKYWRSRCFSRCFTHMSPISLHTHTVLGNAGDHVALDNTLLACPLWVYILILCWEILEITLLWTKLYPHVPYEFTYSYYAGKYWRSRCFSRCFTHMSPIRHTHTVLGNAGDHVALVGALLTCPLWVYILILC